MDEADEFDYIVVGGGTAGCVVAARLAQTPAHRILLIEAGRSNPGFTTRIPALTFWASMSPARNWNFETEPVETLEGRRQQWHQGRMLGGSSGINGMAYMRGHPSEYDDWNCPGWSFAELLPHFKRLEGNSRSGGPWHGSSGPLAIRPCTLDLPICDAFLDAFGGAGFARSDDLDAGVGEGFGRLDCTIGRGVRSDAAHAYLLNGRQPANLKIECGVTVSRIVIERGEARGVEFVRQGQRGRAKARCEVILCAGAINSPALLLASGIGPGPHLRELGIETKVDAPEVGNNLRNHAALVQQFRSAPNATASRFLSPLAAVQACVSYALRRKGPIGESFAAIGGRLKSRPDLKHADTMVILVPAMLQRSVGRQAKWFDALPRQDGFAVVTALARPHSTGRIRLRAREMADRPAIHPDFFTDERDLTAMADSVAIVRRALRDPAITPLIEGGAQSMSLERDAIRAEIVRGATSLSHPTGTCRMGTDSRSVVDPALRVRGIRRLRVADNSIIPGPLNACTQAPAYMIGEKASALILAEN